MKRRRNTALADALAGLIASLVSLWSFYPMDVVKTNVQANNTMQGCDNGVRSSSSSDRRRRILDVSKMYRGMGVKTLHTAASSFCYFYIYSWISSRKGKNESSNSRRHEPSTVRRLVLAAIAAMLNTCITLPLDVLSAKQQTTASTNNSTSTTKAKATMDQVWKEVNEENLDSSQDEKKDDSIPSLSESSVQSQSSVPQQENGETQSRSLVSLWKGLYPSLLLCSNPSIHYTVFDSIKSQILRNSNNTSKQEQRLSMAQAFVVGLFAKFVATMATYPLIRTKILLMVTSQTSMMDCLSQEYQQHGIQGWYKGCCLQLLHTLFKSALLMMVRERITLTTHRMLALDHAPAASPGND